MTFIKRSCFSFTSKEFFYHLVVQCYKSTHSSINCNIIELNNNWAFKKSEFGKLLKFKIVIGKWVLIKIQNLVLIPLTFLEDYLDLKHCTYLRTYLCKGKIVIRGCSCNQDSSTNGYVKEFDPYNVLHT